jgi:hypothetical protein
LRHADDVRRDRLELFKQIFHVFRWDICRQIPVEHCIAQLRQLPEAVGNLDFEIALLPISESPALVIARPVF